MRAAGLAKSSGTYLHACGESSIVGLYSTRVRGKQLHRKQVTHIEGVTPTGAGKTW